MRYDRDDYIKVHYENIDEILWDQFDKVLPPKATTYNVPYDYKSIMHYDSKAFTKNGDITMETLNPEFQDIIGKSKDATPSDYRKVCEIYSCDMCISKSFNTDGDLIKEEMTTEAPNVEENEEEITKVIEEPVSTFEPTSRPVKSCLDIIPPICEAMALSHMLDCLGIGGQLCCAACAHLGF
ncbi:unnamed protein product [Strongylus vulgaris]|uniref:Peptidase M12A domain-containing protein n=1 Tax=Strongylus vulgaris TaxID=40348 RepID=A0A3P7IJ66_STRVU|nr:unnamed protein product [Strongylus vulgaris]